MAAVAEWVVTQSSGKESSARRSGPSPCGTGPGAARADGRQPGAPRHAAPHRHPRGRARRPDVAAAVLALCAGHGDEATAALDRTVRAACGTCPGCAMRTRWWRSRRHGARGSPAPGCGETLRSWLRQRRDWPARRGAGRLITSSRRRRASSARRRCAPRWTGPGSMAAACDMPWAAQPNVCARPHGTRDVVPRWRCATAGVAACAACACRCRCSMPWHRTGPGCAPCASRRAARSPPSPPPRAIAGGTDGGVGRPGRDLDRSCSAPSCSGAAAAGAATALCGRAPGRGSGWPTPVSPAELRPAVVRDSGDDSPAASLRRLGSGGARSGRIRCRSCARRGGAASRTAARALFAADFRPCRHRRRTGGRWP